MDNAYIAKNLIGTYRLVSAKVTFPDGRKIEPFGADPKGHYVFDSHGRFIYLFMRGALANFASNNRMEGTADENKSVVQGSVGGFGTYRIEDNAIMLRFEGSTFPNWSGTEIKQSVVSLAGDGVRWKIGASGGGTAEVALRRVN
jgi:hypothetical protein